VLATDAPADLASSRAWSLGQQHSGALMDLHVPSILDRDSFARQVSWRAVDMNAIPGDLRGFDLCWSACALEHLGGIRHGLDFIAASLDCLRPGGLAVHTTEFNLSSDTDTVETEVPHCSAAATSRRWRPA
jgi:cyclopropane fatty-acyl-phospholipid synthase-like methyltransferase